MVKLVPASVEKRMIGELGLVKNASECLHDNEGKWNIGEGMKGKCHSVCFAKILLLDWVQLKFAILISL